MTGYVVPELAELEHELHAAATRQIRARGRRRKRTSALAIGSIISLALATGAGATSSVWNVVAAATDPQSATNLERVTAGTPPLNVELWPGEIDPATVKSFSAPDGTRITIGNTAKGAICVSTPSTGGCGHEEGKEPFVWTYSPVDRLLTVIANTNLASVSVTTGTVTVNLDEASPDVFAAKLPGDGIPSIVTATLPDGSTRREVLPGMAG